MYTYLTRHIVHAGRYTLLVGWVVVVQVLDTLVEGHEYIGSTVYQLYTGRAHPEPRPLATGIVLLAGAIDRHSSFGGGGGIVRQ